MQRQLRGWTLAEVAAGLEGLSDETLGVDQHMVSRWERGARRPSARYVRLLCRLFNLRADQLGLVEGLDAIDLVPPAGGLTDVERREFLGVAGLMLGEVVFDPLGSESWEGLANAATVQAAAEVIPRYRRLEGAVPSAELLGSVQAHLQLTLRLRSNARTPWARHRLAAAASEAASFAAWLHLDIGDLATAQQHYRLAIEIAGRSEVTLLAAYQLGSLASLVTESGDATEALALLRAAERQLPRPSPAIARAWLWSLRAAAHAAARESLAAQRALEKAQRAAEGPQEEPVWPWLTPFGPDKLSAARGVCEVRLGRHLAAVQALELAVASPGITIRRRGELLVDLSTAHARRREPVLGCQALDEALTVATKRRSPFLLARIRAARGHFERSWLNLPELAAFDERLHTTWL